MKRFLFLLLGFSSFILTMSADDTVAAINLQHKRPDNHIQYFIPADQPDVYYDSTDQTIIIDGGGAVSYYDVEIAPVSSSVPVISTQVSGYYDTIDVSSLSATEYVITIYSPTGNEFEGFFEIE